MLHDGNRATAEFQKFIDHRGMVGNFQWGALARLGLARAYAMQGDTAKPAPLIRISSRSGKTPSGCSYPEGCPGRVREAAVIPAVKL